MTKKGLGALTVVVVIVIVVIGMCFIMGGHKEHDSESSHSAPATTFDKNKETDAQDSVAKTQQQPLLNEPKLITSMLFEDLFNHIEENQIKSISPDFLDFVAGKMIPYFSFGEMLKVILGADWNKISQQDQELLIQDFSKLLIKGYSSVLLLYPGLRIVSQSEKQIEPKKRLLFLKLKGSNGLINMTYDFFLDSRNQWMMSDITADGVSIAITYAGQMRQVYRDAGVDGLFRYMRR